MTGWNVLSLAGFALSALHALRTNAWRSALVPSRPMVADEVSTPPFLTLIVPARNAANTLPALLQDLHAQHYAAEGFEVLVVNDHSEDATMPVVQAMMRTWKGLRAIELHEQAGKKAAITAGVDAARGELIVLTDADARCGPRRLARIAERFMERPFDLLLMPVHTNGDGPLGVLQQEEQAALFGALVGAVDEGRPVLANGANLAFQRSAFLAVGGYTGDPYASGDDIFLVQRMRKAGRAIAVMADPDVLVTVQATTGWRAFLEQRLRWAGKMRGVRDPVSTWTALFSLLLPWGLATLTVLMVLHARLGQGLLFSWTLLLAAWGLWAIPLVRLTGDVHGLWGVAGHRPWRSFAALIAFSLYAPVIAMLSLVWRPRWKGRRT